MAITIKHLIGSDNLVQGTSFQPHQHVSTFHIQECAEVDGEGAPIAPTLTEAAAVLNYLATTSTAVGVRARVGYSLQTYSGAAWENLINDTEFGAWRIRSIDVQEMTNQGDAWKVVVTQTNMGQFPIGDQGSGFVGFGTYDLSINQTTKARKVKAWRGGVLRQDARTDPADPGTATAIDILGPDVSASSDLTLFDLCPNNWFMCNTGQDCEGLSIDLNGGTPTEYSLNNEQITIEWVVRADWEDWDAWQTDANYAWGKSLQFLVNARNVENLFGYEGGYLLLSDVSIQPLNHEFKKISVTFLYDAWRHASQRPWITAGGIVRGSDSCDGVTPPVGYTALPNLVAAQVWWSQPYLLGFSLQTPVMPEGVWDAIWYQLTGAAPAYSPVGAAGSACS